MKTVEELQGMTQTDLVLYIQELQEDKAALCAKIENMAAEYDALDEKHTKSVRTVKSLAELLN